MSAARRLSSSVDSAGVVRSAHTERGEVSRVRRKRSRHRDVQDAMTSEIVVLDENVNRSEHRGEHRSERRSGEHIIMLDENVNRKEQRSGEHRSERTLLDESVNRSEHRTRRTRKNN